MNVVILAGAEHDLDEAYTYYQGIRRESGDDLLVQFRRAVDRILQYLAGWQRMDAVYRRCRLHRFPYGIIYRVDERSGSIVITAVMHLHRRPGSWRRS